MQALLQRIKSHPLVSLLAVMISVVMTLAAFNSAVRNLWRDFMPAPTRAAINGEWLAEVTYDWPNAQYTETLQLMGEGNTLQGSASFLQVPRGIIEGSIKGDQLHWITQGNEMADNRVVRYVYRGKISGDTLQLTLQIENASSPHVPIMFTAKRRVASPAP
jgi:hypothetical protein